MYFITDKRAYISELQRMLFLPRTGRVDNKTIGAIKRIKGEYQTNGSCLVDYATFLEIRKDYKKRCSQNNEVVFRRNDISSDMVNINELIGGVIAKYALSLRKPKGNVFGYDTCLAVKRLREIYCLSDEEIIDVELLRLIKRDLLNNAGYKFKIDG